MPLSEHVYCVAIAFKMTEPVEQQICTKLWVKLEYSSTATIQVIQKASAVGSWWWAAWQHACSCITSRAEFFGETLNHPGDSAPLQPRFGALWLLAFPTTKITFEREEISDYWWYSGKCNGAADGEWESLYEVQRCLLWRGLKRHCPMYKVSGILFNKCLYFSYYMAGYLLDRPHINAADSQIYISNPDISPLNSRISFICWLCLLYTSDAADEPCGV